MTLLPLLALLPLLTLLPLLALLPLLTLLPLLALLPLLTLLPLLALLALLLLPGVLRPLHQAALHRLQAADHVLRCLERFGANITVGAVPHRLLRLVEPVPE